MLRRSAAALSFLLLAASAGSDDALRVQAIQHAGWWELRYPDGTVAANELHVPAGRRVAIEATLDGAGVLWFDGGGVLPRIGLRANVTLTAARAEQLHAHSLRIREPRTSELAIIADDDFDRWLAHQRSAAAPATTAEVARGQAVFATARCTLCHGVRGVAAAEEAVGPDLTHFASRATLAAGALPNRVGFLAGWIVDAETLKPGCGMPVNNVDGADLESLLAFLRSLR